MGRSDEVFSECMPQMSASRFDHMLARTDAILAARKRTRQGSEDDHPGYERVDPTQTRHGAFHGHHEHMHAAHGSADADGDGMHIHQHWHSGDGSHSPNVQELGHSHAEFEQNSAGTLRGDVRANELYGGTSIAERAAARRAAAWQGWGGM